MPHPHLRFLRAEDPTIQHIRFYCDYVIVYLLHESDEVSQWEEANIRVPVYLVQRRGTPRYQLIVQNLANPKLLIDTLHPAWDIDPQENYFFFKTQNPKDQVRGIWLQHDADRQRLTGAVSSALLEFESLGSDCSSEIEDMLVDVTEAHFGGKPTCGLTLHGFDWLASDGAALGATLVATAKKLVAPLASRKASPAPPSRQSLGGRPIKSCQVDAGRSSSLSLFQCKPSRSASISNARELWTSDDRALRTFDSMESKISRTLLVGRSLSMPVACGNEGL